MAETFHVGDVNIFNHDVESSFFSAFLRSMPLDTEYGTSGTPKRCVYVCNKIERIENKYQLIEQEIKKSGVTSNFIVALDIDDRYRNREIKISRRNESIFTAVVRMTSTERVVSETDSIKDIIQNPETPIRTIIDEFGRNRNNAPIPTIIDEFGRNRNNAPIPTIIDEFGRNRNNAPIPTIIDEFGRNRNNAPIPTIIDEFGRNRNNAPIPTIIDEFGRNRNNAVGMMSQFTEWIKTKSTICLVTSYVTMVLLLLTLSIKPYNYVLTSDLNEIEQQLSLIQSVLQTFSIKPYNYVLTSDLNEIEQQLSLIQSDLQKIMKTRDEMKPVVHPRQYTDINNACRFIIPFFCKNDPIHCNVQNTDVIENTTTEFSKSVSDMGNVFIVSGIKPYSFNDITKYFLKMCNTRNPVRSSQYIFLYRFRDQSGKLHEGFLDDCEHDVGPKILDSITNNGIENYAFVIKHTFTSKVVGPKRFQILQNLVIEIANKLKMK